MDLRIGHGYDLHQLSDSEELVLGGITIPHDKGLVGHSDADVLLHAICDACLGALALGDIGYYFPPSDPRYKDIASTKLLGKVQQLVANEGYELQNIDTTVCLQNPKLSSWIPVMCSTIATHLNVPNERVSVKATTNEHVGPEGREEAISAHAVVLLATIQ
jgi:2-C-methyl-D-erythritol 2,4-cyclodiphosphate synthase